MAQFIIFAAKSITLSKNASKARNVVHKPLHWPQFGHYTYEMPLKVYARLSNAIEIEKKKFYDSHIVFPTDICISRYRA